MKNILKVVKKELLRVFKDKKLIIMLILPGILIFAMYNFMGDAMMGQYSENADMTYQIVAVNVSDFDDVGAKIDSINAVIEGEFRCKFVEDNNLEAQEERLKDGDIHILLTEEGGVLIILYNPNVTDSTYALSYVQTALLYDAGAGSVAMPIVEVDATNIVSQLVPFLLLTFLFSGCMSVAPDAIAGEKERGTISTILITPIKRSELALGKVIALAILAVISATSSFLGLMFSLPALMGGVSFSFEVWQYLLVFLVLVSTVLLIIGVMAVISAFAKTVKEAGMMLAPFMFLSMLVGLVTMINPMAASSAAVYLIPLYNTTQAIVSILASAVNPVHLAITILSNFVYVAVAVFALTKMFSSEKIMFKK